MCPLEPEEDCDWQTLQTKKETPDTSGMQQSDLSLYLDHRQLEWGDNKDLFHKSWKFSVHSIVEMFPPSFFIPASFIKHSSPLCTQQCSNIFWAWNVILSWIYANAVGSFVIFTTPSHDHICKMIMLEFNLISMNENVDFFRV